MCIYGLNEKASLASPLVTYFIPSLLIVIFAVVALVQILHHNEIDDDITASTYTYTSRYDPVVKSSDVSFADRCSLGTVVLASCLFIAMWFPHHFVCILLSFCDKCFPPYSVIMAFTWLGASSSFFVPLTLFDANIRARIKSACSTLIVNVSAHVREEETEIHLMQSNARSSF